MLHNIDPSAAAAHDTRLHVKGLSLAFTELKEEWRTAMTLQGQREHTPRPEARPVATPTPAPTVVPRPTAIGATRLGLASHWALTGQFETW